MKDIILAHNAQDTTMKVQLTTDSAGDTVVKNYADTVMVARTDDSTDTKDLATETQLTLAPSASLTTATESKFSVSDIAFVSDSSPLIHDGETSLLSLIDIPTETISLIPSTTTSSDATLMATESMTDT